jgi:unspecific monooxygenase
MGFSITLLSFGVLGLLALYKFFIYPAFLSPLARIPAANFSARFSSFWSNYIRWANIENNALYELHRRLGPIVRLGPNELSVDCYEGGLKTICG